MPAELEEEDEQGINRVEAESGLEEEEEEESLVGEESAGLEAGQEKAIRSSANSSVTAGDDEDENTAVHASLNSSVLSSPLKISIVESTDSATAALFSSSSSCTAADLDDSAVVGAITADNVLDHLPVSLGKGLGFCEALFERSTDLTAKGVAMGIKPFEKAFGLHLQPAFETSKSFVLKQKNSIVEIIKIRAMKSF